MKAEQILDVITAIAKKLGPLRERVVFVGGAATGLLFTDPAASAIRPTEDVDVIVDLRTMRDYLALRDQLLRLGFCEDRHDGAPICRWVADGFKIDIMPTHANILGFSNRWYSPAMEHDIAVPLLKHVES
jgi:hypothetical protein